MQSLGHFVPSDEKLNNINSFQIQLVEKLIPSDFKIS